MAQTRDKKPAVLRTRVKMLGAVLLVAVLASVVVISWRLRQGVEGLQPQPQAVSTPRYLSFPAPANGTFCSGDRARHWATSPPTTAKMVDSSTGWAFGPQRTTDGGSHWVDVSPPSVPNRTPINNQFFLDSMHAWVAETSGSSTACVDKVVTFRTADGGRTWQQAAPIPVRFTNPGDYIWASPLSGANWFSFIDSLNGWLLVGSGPAVAAEAGGSPGFGERWRVGDLYRTTDGGLHWDHVSTDPGAQLGCHAGAGMSFSTVAIGWIAADCGLLVSRDSGVTWAKQPVPITLVNPPVFFGGKSGIILGVEGLLVTSDGGATWSMRSLPGASFVDFINPSVGWAVSFLGNDEMQAEFGLYQTTDGGATWTLTNDTHHPLLPPANAWLARGQDPGAWGLDFVDANHGFWTICGGPPGPCLGNGFFKTADGGHTWTRIEEKIEGRS